MATDLLETTKEAEHLERPMTFGKLEEFLRNIINGEPGRCRNALAQSDPKRFRAVLEAERFLLSYLLQPRDALGELPPDAAPFCDAIIEALDGDTRQPPLSRRVGEAIRCGIRRLVG